MSITSFLKSKSLSIGHSINLQPSLAGLIGCESPLYFSIFPSEGQHHVGPHAQMHLPQSFIGSPSSYAVPKKELKETGCFTRLGVKRAMNEHLCDNGLQYLKKNLSTCLYENGVDVPLTTENKASGNFVALVIPDAIPSRLSLMTRFISLLILQQSFETTPTNDSATNRALTVHFTSGLKKALPALHERPKAFPTRTNRPHHKTHRGAAIQTLVKPIINELLITDHSKGRAVLEAWLKHHTDLATAPKVAENVTSLEQYVRTRNGPARQKAWTATLCFALGVHLDDAELGLIQPVIEAALDSVLLTEDSWAWPKVSLHADNARRLSNGVAVSMAEGRCSEADAKELTKDAAVAAESRFCERKRAVVDGLGEAGSEVVLFLDALEHFAAGHSLWCSTAPRLRVRC